MDGGARGLIKQSELAHRAPTPPKYSSPPLFVWKNSPGKIPATLKIKSLPDTASHCSQISLVLPPHTRGALPLQNRFLFCTPVAQGPEVTIWDPIQPRNRRENAIYFFSLPPVNIFRYLTFSEDAHTRKISGSVWVIGVICIIPSWIKMDFRTPVTPVQSRVNAVPVPCSRNLWMAGNTQVNMDITERPGCAAARPGREKGGETEKGEEMRRDGLGRRKRGKEKRVGEKGRKK